jgi:hypothetical protein
MADKNTVAVDLDGTLNLYVGWRGEDVFDDVRPGARAFMQQLRDAGYRVVVHTTRDAGKAAAWLRENAIPHDDVTNVKVPARVYLDDRAMAFEGSFDGLIERIAAFRPHWQRGRTSAGAEAAERSLAVLRKALERMRTPHRVSRYPSGHQMAGMYDLATCASIRVGSTEPCDCGADLSNRHIDTALAEAARPDESERKGSEGGTLPDGLREGDGAPPLGGGQG